MNQTGFRRGDAVYLRALELGDAPRYASWMNDPELSAFMLFGQRPMSEREEEEWIQNHEKSNTDVLFALCLTDGDRHIGGCGLHKIDPVDRFAVAGIFIGEKELWGKGHGTEAMRLLLEYGFSTLNLHRIELSVFANNERAQRSYRKLGFVEEGRQRMRRWKNGRYIDEIAMGILRDEWLASI